jgi:hypothetical protein
MKSTIIISLFIAVFLTVSEAKTVKLLTIGNSFSNNATTYLTAIANSVPGCELSLTRADIGGCSLEKHAALIRECEANPALKPYFKRYTLKELLQQKIYDVITIQQVSHQSFRAQSYQPHAAELLAFIRKHAPDAQVMIHQTWAYAPDCERLLKFDITRDEMHAGLVECYNRLAQEAGIIRLLRSGEAFYRSYAENPQIDLWNAQDRFHAGEGGCYLAGCVWFGTLFDISPERVDYKPRGMDDKTAVALRTTAATVLKR